MNNNHNEDFYVLWSCVNGSCPLIVEAIKYGVVTSSCEDYCGDSVNYSGCHNCYFENSDICVNCKWNGV